MDHHDQEPTWQGSRPEDGNTFPATPGQAPYPPQQPYPLQSPGWGYPGQPPRRRGLQWWHWLLIAVGSGVLVLCCACGFVGYAVTQSPSFKAGYATAEATRYPQATFTPQATVTPTATVWVFGRMQLGSSAVRTGSGYAIVNPQDHFAARDPFAAVVDLGGPLNTSIAKLLIVRVDSSGTEKVVGLAGGICCTIDPTASWLVFTLPYTETLMPTYPCPPGTYKFEVMVGTIVVAQAKFTYTG